MKNFYADAFIKSQNRLLNLLNKNPASITYGCFDRNYWLHRKVDFPSSTAQLSVLSFAYFYQYKLTEQNLFYQNSNVFNWILACLRFTIKIQNSDGSYDEWYPNERGWGGPTGYIVSSLAETYKVLNDKLPDELKHEIRQSLQKSVDFLLLRDEFDILTNHYAIVLNGITQANEILEDSNTEKSIQLISDKILSLYTQEGWSLEYDGCDLGYNLGTLNFLVDVYKITQDDRILQAAKKCFNFLSYFITPDNQWAANLSSRHTVHNYYYALEFWSYHCPEAQPLLYRLRKAISERHDLLPTDQEDHYIHYRLADYIKAFLNYNSKLIEPLSLPYEQADFKEIDFPESGFFLKKINQALIWISTKRGGALCVYNGNQCVHINNGVLFSDAKNQVYTNLWQSSESISGQLKIKSKCVKYFDSTFKPSTFILFRSFLLVTGQTKLAYYIKRLIRKTLITFKAGDLGSTLDRSIVFKNNQIIIQDLLVSKNNIHQLYCGGNFHTRYVPQGHYFQKSDLNHQPVKIQNLVIKKQIQINTTINLENNKVELCVE